MSHIPCSAGSKQQNQWSILYPGLHVFHMSPGFGFSFTPTNWPMHFMKVWNHPTNMDPGGLWVHQDWPSGVPSWDVHVQVRFIHGWSSGDSGALFYFQFPLTVNRGTAYSIISDGFGVFYSKTWRVQTLHKQGSANHKTNSSFTRGWSSWASVCFVGSKKSSPQTLQEINSHIPFPLLSCFFDGENRDNNLSLIVSNPTAVMPPKRHKKPTTWTGVAKAGVP